VTWSKAPALVLAMIGALALSACGGGAGGATPPPGTQTSTVPPVVSTGGLPDGPCGEATAVLVKEHLAARTDIVSVTTEGGCHDATIVTSLDGSDWQTGLEICDSAAEVAYAGDLSSITVSAADSTELAIGIKGQSCIGKR